MSGRSPFVHALGPEPVADPWGAAAAAAIDGKRPPLPPALSHLSVVFDLSDAETTVILLAAAREFGADVPALTVRLAIAHGLGWESLAPDAPLRRWRLLELEGSAPLIDRPLRIDDRVLQTPAGLGSTRSRPRFVAPARS